ncbi:nucleotidyltransferase family protein [Methylicorpusculum oleiharenae]|uniref:nucleotidyltransferase domain-containing protein n=1 Tax=Methylicorpusculum oleiharenae TaxID=1338687 RepID=UPI00135B50BE|nr:nucleotidyltransferase family protein [Methylicorpusculum oleiharenae]MCD2452579.1 nucleotidyltransferase family protein [Methylicorpusculum oleiharenae]
MDLTKNRVAQVLKNPLSVSAYSPKDWDLLIRQARQSMLLVRLYLLLQENGLIDKLADNIKNHFISATTYSIKQNQSLKWEFRCIEKALTELAIPVIFLKGSAYILASDHAEKGRLFSDVDILVNQDDLPAVESALKKHLWVGTHQNDYDQRYYREWMHELPPMIHLKRQTTLDVHHNILPTTCKTCPDPKKLFANIVKIENSPFWILAPEDRVLHSATHLFHESEFKHGLRDISDIDLLLRQFSSQENFWTQLVNRSIELKQQIPLVYALRYASIILATPLSEDALKRIAPYTPSRIMLKLMDFLFLRVLMPEHSSCEDIWTGLARWLLFIRSHWLKMPLKLLIPHLVKKGYQAVNGESAN